MANKPRFSYSKALELEKRAAEKQINISEECRNWGISTPTYYRHRKLNKKKRKSSVKKPTSQESTKFILEQEMARLREENKLLRNTIVDMVLEREKLIKR